MDSIGYVTSVPIADTAAPLLTLGAHKEKVISAQMFMKLKKATEPHIHRYHEQQEIMN